MNRSTNRTLNSIKPLRMHRPLPITSYWKGTLVAKQRESSINPNTTTSLKIKEIDGSRKCNGKKKKKTNLVNINNILFQYDMQKAVVDQSKSSSFIKPLKVEGKGRIIRRHQHLPEQRRKERNDMEQNQSNEVQYENLNNLYNSSQRYDGIGYLKQHHRQHHHHFSSTNFRSDNHSHHQSRQIINTADYPLQCSSSFFDTPKFEYEKSLSPIHASSFSFTEDLSGEDNIKKSDEMHREAVTTAAATPIIMNNEKENELVKNLINRKKNKLNENNRSSWRDAPSAKSVRNKTKGEINTQRTTRRNDAFRTNNRHQMINRSIDEVQSPGKKKQQYHNYSMSLNPNPSEVIGRKYQINSSNNNNNNMTTTKFPLLRNTNNHNHSPSISLSQHSNFLQQSCDNVKNSSSSIRHSQTIMKDFENSNYHHSQHQPNIVLPQFSKTNLPTRSSTMSKTPKSMTVHRRAITRLHEDKDTHSYRSRHNVMNSYDSTYLQHSDKPKSYRSPSDSGSKLNRDNYMNNPNGQLIPNENSNTNNNNINNKLMGKINEVPSETSSSKEFELNKQSNINHSRIMKKNSLRKRDDKNNHFVDDNDINVRIINNENNANQNHHTINDRHNDMTSQKLSVTHDDYDDNDDHVVCIPNETKSKHNYDKEERINRKKSSRIKHKHKSHSRKSRDQFNGERYMDEVKGKDDESETVFSDSFQTKDEEKAFIEDCRKLVQKSHRFHTYLNNMSEGTQRLERERYNAMEANQMNGKQNYSDSAWKYRNVNDSYAYTNVNEYIKENDLLGKEKKHSIARWIRNVQEKFRNFVATDSDENIANFNSIKPT
ncbi:hypothetical protein SNEBB_001936 [Seison nebaliae]|nr:hypothetical protein SNEBB_001936 [Seison nebaliae]